MILPSNGGLFYRPAEIPLERIIQRTIEIDRAYEAFNEAHLDSPEFFPVKIYKFGEDKDKDVYVRAAIRSIESAVMFDDSFLNLDFVGYAFRRYGILISLRKVDSESTLNEYRLNIRYHKYEIHGEKVYLNIEATIKDTIKFFPYQGYVVESFHDAVDDYPDELHAAARFAESEGVDI